MLVKSSKVSLIRGIIIFIFYLLDKLYFYSHKSRPSVPQGFTMINTDDKQYFYDDQNDIEVELQFGAYMFKKQDYCWGQIKHQGNVVCEITGNYTGFLDFGGRRFWDYRNKQCHMPVQMVPVTLESDARMRGDSIFLRTKPVEEAQAEKVRLENL